MNSKGLALAAMAMSASFGVAAHELRELCKATTDFLPSRRHVGHGSKKSNRKASNRRRQAKKSRKINRK